MSCNIPLNSTSIIQKIVSSDTGYHEKNPIKEATSAELTDLIESTFTPVTDISNKEIRAIAFKEILVRQRENNLGAELCLRVVELSIRHFSFLGDIDEDALKTSLIELCISTLNRENLAIYLKFALDIKSETLLGGCCEYLKTQTNIIVDCDDYKTLQIIIKAQNSTQDLLNFIPYLDSLRSQLPEQNLRIEITPSELTDIEELKIFVSQYRTMIYSLKLTRLADIEEETLQFFLKGTFNLSHLYVQSKNIEGDGIGLQELELLENLQLLDLSICKNISNPPNLRKNVLLHTLSMDYCWNLVAPPDLTNNKELQTLVLDHCWKMIAAPDLQMNIKLKTLKMFGCNALTTAPNIRNCMMLEHLDLYSCPSMSQESVLDLITNLVETAPELVFRLGISSFNLIDTHAIEKKIAQEHPLLYLDKLHQFRHPNQEARISAFKQLIDIDQEKALRYALKLAIEDKNIFRELALQIEEFKNYLIEREILSDDFDPVNLVFSYLIHKAVASDDFNLFHQILPEGAFDSIVADKNDLQLREFFIKYKKHIKESPHTVAFLKKLYPPNAQNTSIFYEIEGHLENRNIHLSSNLYAPMELPHEILTLLAGMIHHVGNGGLPDQLRVSFIEQKGVDAGGLGRELMIMLINALVGDKNKNSPLNFHLRTSSGLFLPHQKKLGSKVLLTQEEIDGYINLGKIFAFLLGSSRDYPVGEIFDPEFFNILLSLNQDDDVAISPEAYQERLNKLDLNAMLTLCASIIEVGAVSSTQIEMAQLLESCTSYESTSTDVREKLELYGIDADNFEEDKHYFLNLLKMRYLSTYAAIQAVARGIAECFPIVPVLNDNTIVIEKWDDLKSISPTWIAKRIQGELSKDRFKQAIEISAPDTAKASEVKKWFNEWIKESDITSISRIIRWITGSSALTGKIKVYVSAVHQDFRARTCFSSLDFPLNATKEAFKLQLNIISSTEMENGFNEA